MNPALERLRDQNPQERLAAISQLLGFDPATWHGMNLARTAGGQTVRPSEDRDAAIEALIERLGDEDPKVREHAVIALTVIGDAVQSARRAIAPLMLDPCAQVREACCAALLGQRVELDALIPLAADCFEHTDDRVLFSFLLLVSRNESDLRKDSAPLGEIERLLGVLERTLQSCSFDETRKKCAMLAADIIGKLGPESTKSSPVNLHEALIFSSLSESPAVRAHAARALERLGYDLEALEPGLRDETNGFFDQRPTPPQTP